MKKSFLSPIVLLGLLVLVSGCSNVYNVVPTGASVVDKLEKGAKILVLIPKDGGYGNKIEIGSGQITADLFQAALRPFASEVILSNPEETLESVLEKTATNGCKYVFVPTITNWEHRVAAWSGIPSRVAITVSIYELANVDKRKVKDDAIDVRGKISTLKSQFPKEIAKAIIEQYVKTLY